MHPELTTRRVTRRSNGKWGQRVAGSCFWAAVELADRRNEHVWVIQAGHPGSKIVDWRPPNGKNWIKIISRVMSLNLGVDGIVWWQGEAELKKNGDHVTNYGAHLTAIIGEWRAAYGTNFPWAAMRIPTGFRTGFNSNKLAMLAEYDEPTTAGVTGYGVVESDDIPGGTHPKAVEEYGRRLGAKLDELL